MCIRDRLSIFEKQNVFRLPDHRTQAVYLRGCEQLANALLQELTALCAMDEKGRLSPENAEKLSALGLHVPDTLPAPPQSDADVVGNYHLSGLLQAYHYPVSYTHLDVYKRQHSLRSARRSRA